jgi:hypothetical protein
VEIQPGADSNPPTYELLHRLEDMLLALKPGNPRDQWWMGQAMTLASKIGETRWLIAQQVGQGRRGSGVPISAMSSCSNVQQRDAVIQLPHRRGQAMAVARPAQASSRF